MISREDFCSRVDFARLTHNHSRQDMLHACRQAVRYGFAALCVNPCEVALCKEQVKGTGVSVGTVIGYPLGVNTTRTKIFEAMDAVENGADELDVVLNVSRFNDGDDDYVLNELQQVVGIAKAMNPKVLVKVIIERYYIKNEDLPRVCELVIASGADFVKQASGYAPADIPNGELDIKRIREIVGDRIRIKAAFGCGETLREFCDAIEYGADRVGTPIADIKLEETPDNFWMPEEESK